MKKIVALIMFWVGTLYIFIASWLVMWWVAPVWQNTPIEQFAGTLWEFEGLIYMSIGLSLPLGILLAAIGIIIYTKSDGFRSWQFYIIIAVIVFAVFSIVLLPTLRYYPTIFGIFGFFILIFFFASIWFWAKKRKTLEGREGFIADLKLLSYIFFYMAANFSCTLLGNPISGLFFPEKVMHYQSLPAYYAMGLKQALYFALGFLFILLSNYIEARKEK